jgi:hypothetical protein
MTTLVSNAIPFIRAIWRPEFGYPALQRRGIERDGGRGFMRTRYPYSGVVVVVYVIYVVVLCLLLFEVFMGEKNDA